jgi:putative phosphoribosyl transferase
MFRDRSEAGTAVAQLLTRFAKESGVVVMGVARGGVPVARQVAQALDAPFGVVVARRFGVPGVEEVALGAIAEGSRRIALHFSAQQIGVPARVIERLATRERVELERCASVCHAVQPLPDLRDRVVLLIDDGLASGVTLRAAARAVRRSRPARLVVAVPVASPWGSRCVEADVDELIAVATLPKFETVAAAYEDFTPIGDDALIHLLGRPIRAGSAAGAIANDIGIPRWTKAQSEDRERTILIPAPGGSIVADLGMPPPGVFASDVRRSCTVRGLVVLAPGDGSTRNSFANRYIAGRLRFGGYATVRVDLRTQPEQRTGGDVALRDADVEQRATRLASACDWALREGVPGAQQTTIIGTGSGAAASLLTAARRRGLVRAVIGRGAPDDFAPNALSKVDAAVLLLVGTSDRPPMRRHDATPMLPTDVEIVRVPRAATALDEPGAIGSMAECMSAWLDRLDRLEARRLRRRSRT